MRRATHEDQQGGQQRRVPDGPVVHDESALRRAFRGGEGEVELRAAGRGGVSRRLWRNRKPPAIEWVWKAAAAEEQPRRWKLRKHTARRHAADAQSCLFADLQQVATQTKQGPRGVWRWAR